MAKIILTAHKATFGNSGPFRTMQYRPLEAPIARREVEAKNAAEIVKAQELLRDELVATGLGYSFIVAFAVARGERAPRGSKQLKGYIEHDAGKELAEAA